MGKSVSHWQLRTAYQHYVQVTCPPILYHLQYKIDKDWNRVDRQACCGAGYCRWMLTRFLCALLVKG